MFYHNPYMMPTANSWLCTKCYHISDNLQTAYMLNIHRNNRPKINRMFRKSITSIIKMFVNVSIKNHKMTSTSIFWSHDLWPLNVLYMVFMWYFMQTIIPPSLRSTWPTIHKLWCYSCHEHLHTWWRWPLSIWLKNGMAGYSSRGICASNLKMWQLSILDKQMHKS